MTSSNPNSPTNSPLNFRPFALGKRGQKFRFIPTNVIGLTKPVITQALQTGGDAIQITWGESGGTSYEVGVSTNGGASFSALTTTSDTSYTHTGLSFPGSYTYRVRATLDAEVSDWSDNVTETMVDIPSAPTGLAITGATTSSISLSWNDTADEESFTIEASVDGLGSWTSAGSTGQNVVTFTHSGLPESVQRHYRVIANNKAGGSLPSSTANSWTVPAAPTGLSATAISTTQIDLSWTDVSTGNQSYKVERSTDNVNWTEIATGLSATATTYSATGLTASTLYYFRVRAANAARNSDYSSSASATTQSGALSPSWSLDFSSGTPSGYVLTRASSGTYVDSSGYIASQASGASGNSAARLTHNSSGSRLGLLVEEQRTNIALATENFTDTARWPVTNATAADTTNAAPDNGADAESITEVAATSASYRIRSGSMTTGVAAGDTFTSSCFLKDAPTNGKGYGYVSVTVDGGTVRTYTVIVNLSTGALETTMTSGSPTGTAYTIENYGNGWYRVSATVTAQTGATGVRVLMGMWQSGATNSSGYPTYTVSAGNEKSILAWGAQIEEGATPTSYLANTAVTGSGVTRSADLAHVLDSSITSWGDPGALVIHFYPPGQAGTLLSTDDVANEQLGIQASTTTAARAFWSSGNTATGTIGTGVQKAVHYWSGTASSFCINGGTVHTGTNNIGTFGNINFVTLGAEATVSAGVPNVYSQFSNLIIRKVEFYAGTLTSGNLQTITT